MKKRFFYNHPILGGLIALAIAAVICNGLGFVAFLSSIMSDLIAAFKDGVITTADEAVDMLVSMIDNDKQGIVFNGCVTIAAFLCLPVFSWLNRKNGFRGLFKVHGTELKDVWVCIAVFATTVIVSLGYILFTLLGGFPKLPAPSFGMIVLAVYAGVNEEIIDRAIPGAVMLRNKPTSRRIWATILLTSLLFGLGHFINLGEGQGFEETVQQVIFACGMGLFFAGIYLRTGCIAITIVVHALYDLLVFFFEQAFPNGQPSFGVLDIVLAAMPFVLGILMLLPKYHPAIIETWTHIWPEKNTPVETVNE